MRFASEIRWGTSFENVIAFDPFPTDGSKPTMLDDLRTWRRPVAGSERARNDAGVTDAWIRKRDYILAGRARHFGGQGWGANGLQAFLDWAGEGNTFRLIPDRRYPSFYVDSCYLEEPFENPEPQLEESDGTQSIDILIRQQAVDFTQAMRGVMFEYVPGMDITKMGGTFTRATTAYQADRNGIFRSVASGALRDAHFIGGYRHTLLEPARTNSILSSSTGYLGAPWSPSGLSGANATSCINGQIATRLTADGVTGSPSIGQNVGTFVNGQTDCAYMIIENVDATESYVGIWDGTAGAMLVRVRIVWSTGVATIVQGTGTGGVLDLGNGRKLLWVAGTGTAAGTGAAGNQRRFIYYPVHTTANATAAIIHHCQAELNAAFPTSPVVTAGASVTRNVDLLSFAIGFAPQVLSMYSDGVDVGAGRQPTGLFAITTMATLGRNVGGDYDLSNRLNANGVDRRAQIRLGSAGDVPSQAIGDISSGTLAFYDRMEMVGRLYSDGRVDAQQAINGGAAVTGSLSVDARPLEATWGANTVEIGGYGSVVGGWAIRAVRIMPGLQALATIRAA